MPTLYVNQFPELLEQELEAARQATVEPIEVPSNAFSELANVGHRMIYVVLTNGRLTVAPRHRRGRKITHAALALGDRVLAAGEFSMETDGPEIVVSELDDMSGHYEPGAAAVEIAREAFEASGIRVLPDALTTYSWRTS